MRKAILIGGVAAALAAALALPTLAQRSFDPSAVSAEKVISVDSTDDGAWALTSSGKILFCAVDDEQSPKVICFDKSGRTGIDY